MSLFSICIFSILLGCMYKLKIYLCFPVLYGGEGPLYGNNMSPFFISLLGIFMIAQWIYVP